MICKYCGKEFTPTDKRQKYCSPECKAARDREIKRDYSLAHREEINARNRKIAEIKNGWLTIPDAPTHEISADLQIRNKSNGKISHSYTPQRCTEPACAIMYKGKQMIRSLKTWRNQAVAAALADLVDEWYPVPSLDNLYEFNNKNQIRNVATKKILACTPTKDGYNLKINCKCRYVSIVGLRWEIFGELIPFGSRCQKAVIISKGRTSRWFDCHIDAVRFIAETEFYSPNFIEQLFVKRRTYIHGWTINYLENDTNVGDYLQGMQTKDPRQAKTK